MKPTSHPRGLSLLGFHFHQGGLGNPGRVHWEDPARLGWEMAGLWKQLRWESCICSCPLPMQHHLLQGYRYRLSPPEAKHKTSQLQVLLLLFLS